MLELKNESYLDSFFSFYSRSTGTGTAAQIYKYTEEPVDLSLWLFVCGMNKAVFYIIVLTYIYFRKMRFSNEGTVSSYAG